jgi:predicted nucleic acid-binding protein
VKPYADTNFLVCLYLDLAESEKAIQIIRRDRDRATLPIAWLHRLEMMNALQSYVFLTQTGGQARVTAESAHAAHASFRSDVAQASFLVPADLTIGELEGPFEELALRHTARHGFRTYDLLHVASALLLGCDTFLSFDSKARKLAALEGLSLHTIAIKS